MSTQEINQEPNWLRPKFENIPEELQKQPWAVWNAEQKFDKQGNPTGRWSKAPRDPSTGILIGSNKPFLFGTFEEAKKAYESGSYTGVGVLLTGNGIIGVDIDHLEESSKQDFGLKEWIQNSRKLGAYCELSPSGTGLRLFIKGNLKDGGYKVQNLEIYANQRFLTLTGHTIQSRRGS